MVLGVMVIMATVATPVQVLHKFRQNTERYGRKIRTLADFQLQLVTPQSAASVSCAVSWAQLAIL